MARGGRFHSIVNLANTILGAGILSLAYAVAQSGMIPGLIFIFFFGCCSAFGLYLLNECAALQDGPSSFHTVALQALGTYRRAQLIDAAVAIKCFGVSVSYLIVIGDMMPDVMKHLNVHEDSWLRSRAFWIALFWVVFVVPTSCLKSMKALTYTSAVSLGLVFWIVLITVLHAVGALDPCMDVPESEECKGPVESARLTTGTLRTLGTLLFAYTCHQNIFLIRNELENPTRSRILSVIVGSIGTAFIVYVIVSVSGYMTYGSKVTSDLIVAYPANALLSVSRIFIAIHVAFTVPMQMHPCRAAVISIIWGGKHGAHHSPPASDAITDAHPSLRSESGADLADVEAGTSSEGLGLRHPLSPTSGYDSMANRPAAAPQEEEEEEAAETNSITLSTPDEQYRRLTGSSPQRRKSTSTLPPGFTMGRMISVTGVLLVAAFIIALFVDDLGKSLSVVGASGSVLISYVLPGLCYVCLFRQDTWTRRFAFGLIFLGLAVVPSCLTFIFI